MLRCTDTDIAASVGEIKTPPFTGWFKKKSSNDILCIVIQIKLCKYKVYKFELGYFFFISVEYSTKTLNYKLHGMIYLKLLKKKLVFIEKCISLKNKCLLLLLLLIF